MKKLRLCIISDTHEEIETIPPNEMPEADVLVHCGDFTKRGSLDAGAAFLEWLSTLKQYSKIIFIAGNHDSFLEYATPKTLFLKYLREKLGDRAVYLEHQSYEYAGWRFFGTPYVPQFCNLAFNRQDAIRKKLWEDIPGNTEILLSHCPPRGVLDGVPRPSAVIGQSSIEACGCPFLIQRLGQLYNLQLHAFGHIHEWGGHSFTHRDHIKFANGCMLNPDPKYFMKPIVVEVEKD